MIISHRHRFIFIKTRKTAGTSVEIALSRFCGEDDIVTHISPQDEVVRSRLGYPGPQHTRLSPFRYTSADWVRLFTRLERAGFYNHIPARLIRERIGEEVWSSYFKFCFERNPWDKAISMYFWRTRRDDSRRPIAEFIAEQAEQLSDFDLYTLDGRIAVDQVGRFETLQADLDEIARKLDLPGEIELPTTKSSARKEKRHYRDVLGPPERDRIAEVGAREIGEFGYCF